MGTMGMWRHEDTWGQHGDNMGITGMWRPHEDNVETTSGHKDVETMWGQCGDNMGTTGFWRPHGDNMTTGQ